MLIYLILNFDDGYPKYERTFIWYESKVALGRKQGIQCISVSIEPHSFSHLKSGLHKHYLKVSCHYFSKITT